MEPKETFVEWLTRLIKPFRAWVEANYTNPLLWIGLVVLGLAIFGFTYNALNKER